MSSDNSFSFSSFPGPAGPTDGQSRYISQRLGQYQILRHLGRGGMGDVYEALHTKLSRRVAIKVLRRRLASDPDAVERFHREMELIGRLNHPHIVQAFDAGDFEDTIYLVMEFVDGCTAEALAQRVGPFAIPIACEIVRQTALGLQHAHEHGLVHRDVKPSNILIAKGIVKLSDLGLAKMQDERRENVLTTTGTILGTPDYIAPEQVEGAAVVDIRADLYSLGCTLYRFLAGRPPFGLPVYSSDVKKIFAHVHDTPQPVEILRPDLPAELVQIVGKLLSKRPADRFEQPGELESALVPFAVGHSLSAFIASTRDASDTTRTHFPTEPTTIVDQEGKSTSESFQSLSPFRTESLRAPRDGRGRIVFMGLLLCGAILWGVSRYWPSTPRAGEVPRAHSIVRSPIAESSVPASQRADSDADSNGPLNDSENVTDYETQWKRDVGELPQELQWPDRRAGGTWWLDSETKSLLISSPIDTLRFIRLGELDGRDCDISIDIKPQGWNSIRGLFFGFRLDPETGEPSVQMIDVNPSSAAPERGGHHVVIRRQKATFRSGSPFLTVLHQVPSEVQDGNRELFRMSVHIRNSQIAQVFLDNAALPPLVARDVSEEYPSGTYLQGPWGVFHAGQTTLFTSPAIRFPEPKGD